MGIEEWEKEFDRLYLKRVGITPEEGGVSEDELDHYFDSGFSPNEAVSEEISRYGLADSGNNPFGW